MRLVNEATPHPHAYYISHHGVFKAKDPNGKIQVVFNASAKAPSGHSLYSLMHTGPKLQKDLWIIFLRWKKFKFVYTTDYVKFYRQIAIHQDDQHLLSIFFTYGNKEIPEFELTTNTCGTLQHNDSP